MRGKTVTLRLMSAMFVFSCAVVLLVSFYSLSLAGFFLREMENRIETKLRETSKRGAALITVEELEKYQKPEDMKLSGYQDLRHKLRTFAPDADTLYIYYLRRVNTSGDKIQYIIDNGFDEAKRDGLDTPTADAVLAPGLKGALEGRVEALESGIYMDGGDGLFSAYTPMFDAEGRVAAVCGVDINDEIFFITKRRENQLRIMEIMAVIVVFISGMLCLMGYSREVHFSREANIFKSKFLASLGHEMRSPLSAMSANAQLAAELFAASSTELHRKTKNLEEIRAALFAVKDEADRLSRMSNAAITLGEEQSIHRERGEKIRLDIARLLRSVCGIYKPMVESHNNNLLMDISGESGEGLLYVHGNADELSEVLINLISNANEQTQNGEILVSATNEAGAITVMVSDNGQGIEPDDLPGIFERRPYRGASDKTGGIGLSICREIIKDHNGKIWIESNPNKGTRVFFRLSLSLMDAGLGIRR